MAMREFRDSHGVEWVVWEVIAMSSDRRRLRDRRRMVRRNSRERRQRLEPPLMLSRGGADGWLAFECAHERRRLRPIPKDWFELNDAELEELSQRAVPGRKPRRLLD